MDQVGRGYHDRFRPRMPYGPGLRSGVGYGLSAWPGYYAPYGLGYPYGYSDTTSYDNDNGGPASYPDANAYQGSENAPYGYGPEPPNQYPQEQRGPYTAFSQPPNPVMQSNEGAVTVIFNDGRAPEQIHNYLLTSTTLMVLDGGVREIPLGQVNVAATEQANRPMGVDFRVPGKSM